MASYFFAMLSRMKYINRWGLMRNTKHENLSEHTLEVAFIAQALAEIRRKRLGLDADIGRVLALALYHDASEIFTGDLPTPIKYYNDRIRDSYKNIERTSSAKLLSLLPEDLRPEYAGYLLPPDEGDEMMRLIKAADKISALIKCVEEERMGNADFVSAKAAIIKKIENLGMPEVDIFMRDFFPAYLLTIDDFYAVDRESESEDTPGTRRR